MVATDAADLRQLLLLWTGAAAAMTQGKLLPGSSTNVDAPPADTGEALGLGPGNLTITIGYGPKLFDQRFGLAKKRPSLLQELPPLPNEDLDPSYVGGDISVQACSDDPIVAFHALRDLARIGIGTVAMRWMQIGFGSTARTSAPATPRNLLGFKDGTRNIDGSNAEAHGPVRVDRERNRSTVAAERLVSRHASHPHVHRELGPRPARRPGRHHRPLQGVGRTAERQDGVRHPRLQRP